MEYTMGKDFWKNRRADLEEERVKKRAESEELRKKELKKLMRRRKTKIMRKMGCFMVNDISIKQDEFAIVL